MNNDIATSDNANGHSKWSVSLRWPRMIAGVGVFVAIAAGSALFLRATDSGANAPPPSAPVVSVSYPVQRDLEAKLGFLGQFSAVERVELRAQVGGTLTQIHFKDGEIVKKGDLLFVIDPVPYEIKLSQAQAQLQAANARLDLATRQLARAEMLKRQDAGSTENVDQSAAEKQTAQASVNSALALVRDARFDLDHSKITAPFTGRIGTHLVSVGNLVSGSRGGAGGTTLLTTIVSLDPMYLDFDMSEADYTAFLKGREGQRGALANKVELSLGDDATYSREGTLDFIDNALNRSSGTIRARALVPNGDFMLTAGAFARVRLAVSAPQAALLVPDATVLADQSEHVVMTVNTENVVTPKRVELGEVHDGLRVIRSGLSATDRVIVEGIPIAAPGAKVSPQMAAAQMAAN